MWKNIETNLSRVYDILTRHNYVEENMLTFQKEKNIRRMNYIALPLTIWVRFFIFI